MDSGIDGGNGTVGLVPSIRSDLSVRRDCDDFRFFWIDCADMHISDPKENFYACGAVGIGAIKGKGEQEGHEGEHKR